MNVLLLCGGYSAEREVSIRSGRFVEAGLREAGHHVSVLDPARVPLDTVQWGRFDCCFPALHGGAGEDGRIQRILEQIGIPFVGSGSAASRLAMHKAAAKECFGHFRVPTPGYLILGENSRIRTEMIARILPAPWVVKPECQGSSIGVRFVPDSDKLRNAVKNALFFSRRAIVETAIEGTELTVAVMGRRPLPVLEIAHGRSVYDMCAKYAGVPGSVRLATHLGPMQIDTVENTAVEAADALGTSGLVRVDLILDGSGTPWVLEVNTIPGLTATSLAPGAAAAAGYDRAALCEWMLESSHGKFGNERGETNAYRRAA